ncbi:hypothetical protein CYL18_05060 [Pradoshia eiseniae]|uniref:Regulatory protein YycH domain-containing protein n=1 Tax=Pradoshia eiseniae TaxID=2064768 RepID=A0A2S7N1R3_9BACI|nr:two-component system activity regulator YycH [Pradoshia eiseniae]PQD95974.1 hypothetical protein CYL18_05060 [Pradoshia eiseniae]
MSWEGLKNILLFSLIVISGLLTWSYWFYQPSYEIDIQHVQTKIMSNGNMEPDEVVQPIKMLYYDESSYYGTYSEEMVSEMMDMVKNVTLFNLQNRSESYGDVNDIKELVERDGAIEVVFNDSVPLSFYKKFLKIEDSIVPDVYFDRIVVFTEEREDVGHSVYFISEDKKAVLAAALEKEDLEQFGTTFANTELYEKYQKVAITDNRSVIVPANEQRVTGYSYLTKFVSSASFMKALFSSPEIVKQEGDIYTDGVSLMKVNSKTGMIEYKNLAVGAKEEKNTDKHILQRNIDYINSHSGWDRRYRFADMDEEEREIIYRLYISGLPVFSDIGNSEFDVEWGTENVRMYERPYMYLGDKALTKSDAILPRAEDALIAFQESLNKQYNPDKLADMTIGFEMLVDDKTGTDIVTLKPNWYFLYDNSWIKIMDKGGIMDGLE